MGRGDLPSIRSLPRVFVPGASAEEPIELPREEVEKLRKVLRLPEGSQIAVLPNDGSIIRCEFRARMAHPLGIEWPKTEAALHLTLAQALPKGDRIDTVIHMCTEIGVSRFVFFESDRSVARWDETKRNDRGRRLRALAMEAAEQSFRTKIPEIGFDRDLASILEKYPNALVLSEVEDLSRKITDVKPAVKTQPGRGASAGEAPSLVGSEEIGPVEDHMVIVVGPEGGWSPREIDLIGDRGVTLGPRVLRADTAGAAAAAIILLGCQTS